MVAQTMPAPPPFRWLPPPWSIPRGRKPAIRRRIVELVPVDGLYLSILGAWAVNSPSAIAGDSMLVAYRVVVVLGAIVASGYGALMIATASRPRVKPTWAFQGLTSTPTAARWYGVAFLFAEAVVWVSAVVSHFTPVGPPPVFEIKAFSSAFSPVLGIVSFSGCILMARRAANRPIKQAILSGLAPGYAMASGMQYWWDGERWRSVAEGAPEGALRSPDGHYWWTGGDWAPMPPDRPVARPIRKASAA